MYRRLLALSALLLAATACSNDKNPTDPPPPPDDWTRAVCARGEVSVGRSVTGTVNSSDCDSADIVEDDEGYFESWLMTVSSTRTVEFDLSSGFDNYLTVVAVWEDSGEIEAEIVAVSDDRAPGNTDAFARVRLEPGATYVIAVGGYDYGEQGSYRLTVR